MTPGELFARLWAQINIKASLIISTPWPGRTVSEYSLLRQILCDGVSSEVPNEIEDYLAGGKLQGRSDVPAHMLDQRAFVVMCALDSAAMAVHPSMPTRVGGKSVALAPMLVTMKQMRTANGIYGEHEGLCTIPKGQLAKQRGEPEIDWASGANLETQFEYLTVLRRSNERFSVQIEVVPPRLSPLSGPPKMVGIAPIAEDAEDLIFTSHERGGRPYLDARPVNFEGLRSRLIEGVIALLGLGAELIVLPELVASQDTSEALAAALRARPGSDALIVCGSGLTKKSDETGLCFNESVVLTGQGVELFRQRKIHPFNMAVNRMHECNIPFAEGCEDKPHMEDIEPYTELMVRDLPGVGRMLVAICEDLEQPAPVGDTILATRPDWVITPVMDISQEIGRWSHQRSMELGRKTGSQFVVSCCASLTVRKSKVATLSNVPPGQMGLGVLYAGDTRRVRIVDASENQTVPRAIVIDWRPEVWPRDNVTTKQT